MSKDPAFLFYPESFLGGVSDLTMEERGQYITLLCLQHSKGRLSEKTIRLSVGLVSVDVRLKFRLDENGLLYNERLEEETQKREKFANSRRENGKKGGRPTVKSIENKEVNEYILKDNAITDRLLVGYPKNNLPININKNKNKDINKDKSGEKKLKRFEPPSLFEVENYFIENGFDKLLAQKAFEYYNIAEWKDSRGVKVQNWKQKMRGVWMKEENKTQINGNQLNYNKTGVWNAEGTALDAIAQLRNRRTAAN